MKYIRLISRRDPFYEVTRDVIDVVEPYLFSKIPKIEQVVFSLEKLLHRTIMNPKLKNLKCDALLINDGTTPEQVRYIRKYNTSLNIILGYSNPVLNAKYKPKDYDDLNLIFTSFQESDCIRYGMHYIPATFNARLPIDENNTKYDAVFFGKDKGRKDLIKFIDEAIRNAGFSTYIHVSPNENKVFIRNGYKRPIKYKKMLSYYQSCDAIIDIQQAFQDGLEIRAMAAILMNKKLIINNPKIANEPFYNKNNIFILGVDPIEDIGVFLKKPLVPYDKEIQGFYSYERRYKQLDELLAKKGLSE